MKPPIHPVLDPRRAPQIVQQLLDRRPGYLPDWLLPNDLDSLEKSPGSALLWIYARYLDAILGRLNQVPDKYKLAFLDQLGIDLIPARAARAPVVFTLSDKVGDTRAPAGTQVVAPPPPETTDQIVFETEQAVGLAAASLKEIVSLWPRRDQYINHSAAYERGESFRPFYRRDLEDIPHHIYVAHDTLLALAGEARVNVAFELTQTSNEHLEMIWEYWDGKVWRGFRAMHPLCADKKEKRLDSTDGLTQSGLFQLRSDCAKAAKRTVNGIEAFWIRGTLDESLLPKPALTLPLVDSVRLSSEIIHPLALTLTTGPPMYQFPDPEGTHHQLRITVQDENGAPVAGAILALASSPAAEEPTDADGKVSLSQVPGHATKETIILTLADAQVISDAVPLESKAGVWNLLLTLQIGGIQPDQAVTDEGELDVTNPFYPRGKYPKPGSTFYFTSEEIFSKPGAEFRIYLPRAATPQDGFSVEGETAPQDLPHTVSWEYWNGRRWALVGSYSNDPGGNSSGSPRDFTASGTVDLVVPEDMTKTEVNDEEALWMRVRLVSGSFGFRQTVSWGKGDANKFSYVVAQPPALTDFRMGYTWQCGPFPAERVVTYNDFRYEDHTEDALWSGQVFQPLQLVRDVTPALYLGFDKKLPVDRLNLYCDIQEESGETRGPALDWEYWDGSSWCSVAVADETNHLRVPGMLSFIGAEDSEAMARFDASLHWLRGRLREDGPPGAPTINGIFLNAVWASQQRTVTGEPIGKSNGRPGQVFDMRQIPILPGETIEVRELWGPRANVEWRILAMEILGEDYRIIQELEDELRQEDTDNEIQSGDLRLRRDRHKRVTEVWVQWHGQRHLYTSGSGDRHYVLAHSRGRLRFGDGEHGRVPPAGGEIRAREYRAGGGRAGNVKAEAISQLLAGIGGIEAVSNPQPATGGADAETLPAVLKRGPETLRHRERALSPHDYETMAREASAAVAVARAIPTRDDGGRQRPGWVTVIIIPHSEEDRPRPTFGLRDQVRRYIAARAPASVAAANQIHVTGPSYQEIDVEAVVVPLDPTQAGIIEQRVRGTLENFLHPLRGGPEGCGWTPGRDVFLSDAASVLERVEGVDYVRELSLLLEGALQREYARVPGDRIAVAGQISIRMLSGERTIS